MTFSIARIGLVSMGLLLLFPLLSWSLDEYDPRLVQALRLTQQVQELNGQGQYAKALPLAKEALMLIEQVTGPDHIAVATGLNNLAGIYQGMGNLKEARPLYERALRIKEKALGPKHPDVALSLNNLASLLDNMGEYQAARPLFEQALLIREQALGPKHADVAQSLNNLASLLREMGDYVTARSLLDRSLRIKEQLLGPSHPDLAISINNLAVVYQDMGDYEAALPLFERSLRIREQALGPTHPDVAVSLATLAGLRQDMGDYAAARPLYERALRILEGSLGTTHQKVAAVLNNLGGLVREMGDYTAAQALYERALKIDEQTLGPRHPAVATTLNNLAGLLRIMGDHATARVFYERALKIDEQTLGPRHPAVATTLNNIGLVYSESGDFAAARRFYEQALRIQEKTLGGEHPLVAISLANLAVLNRNMGNNAAAQPLLERAFQIREKALGPHHPIVADSLAQLALLSWDSGHGERAADLLARAMGNVERFTARGLAGIAVRQQLAFVHTTNSYFSAYLSLPESYIPASTAYSATLVRKNLVFRALTEERTTRFLVTDSAVSGLIKRREQLVRELARLVVAGRGSTADMLKRESDLEKELEDVESTLSRTVAGFRRIQSETRAGAVDVCHALPGNSALLDYIRYARYYPSKNGKHGRWEDSYVVFLLRSGHCKEVKRIDLGPAGPLDQAASEFRQSLTGTISDQIDQISEKVVAAKAHALGALAFPKTIRETLGGVTTLLVAPDGPLAVVPFALLPGEGGHTFLFETHTLAMIPSGRDLLRLALDRDNAAPAHPSGTLLVGNPDYGAILTATEVPQEEHRGVLRAGCGLGEISFPPLPATATEIAVIAQQAGLTGMNVDRAEGSEANETWLKKRLSGHRFIHLATHGYFAGDSCMPSGASMRGVVVQAQNLGNDSAIALGSNPLLLSGIALAGANVDKQTTYGADDGILTALEVTGLDLRGTEMVVLSACETGLGVQHVGQELLGLRWSFGMAGARSLLTSLWKVPDEPTVDLMTKFYGYLWRDSQGAGPVSKAAALRQAQLDLMKENRARYNGDSRPNNWGAWVLSGDWQ